MVCSLLLEGAFSVIPIQLTKAVVENGSDVGPYTPLRPLRSLRDNSPFPPPSAPQRLCARPPHPDEPRGHWLSGRTCGGLQGFDLRDFPFGKVEDSVAALGDLVLMMGHKKEAEWRPAAAQLLQHRQNEQACVGGQ